MDARLESTRQETSLRDFLDVVFRRKWVIVSILVAVTLLVVVLDARRPTCGSRRRASWSAAASSPAC